MAYIMHSTAILICLFIGLLTSSQE